MSRAPRSQKGRQYWGDDDSQSPILHIDMDAFFASVEIMDNPELADKPIAVGGLHRGVVSAASYAARAFGVQSAMPVGLAYQKCPQLTMLPVRMERYVEVSRHIMSIFHEITPHVEKLSIDEAFLDVSSAYRLFGTPVQIGHLLRSRIREEVGVPASVGIAATKHIAKIASAHAKPDGLLLIPKSASLDFLHVLPIGALWGVGEKTGAKLELNAIETIGDLAHHDFEDLVRLVGSAQAYHLYDLAWGRDGREVVVERAEKSLGVERTFYEPLSERDDILPILLAQAHEIARRARAGEEVGSTLVLKVRFADFSSLSRSVTFTQATNVAGDMYEAAVRLLDSVTIPTSGIRLIGLRLQKLTRTHEGVQLVLGGDTRRADAENVLDDVRARFGEAAATPATLLPSEKSVQDMNSDKNNVTP
ncbi:MAG: DNA polymerase IV [Actinomycetaceae bacterium]|nr:DNA polymerase IV [Actinomycetaceae bacterium]